MLITQLHGLYKTNSFPCSSASDWKSYFTSIHQLFDFHSVFLHVTQTGCFIDHVSPVTGTINKNGKISTNGNVYINRLTARKLVWHGDNKVLKALK